MKRAPVSVWALLPLALALSACGLQPMYAGGSNGAVAQGLAAVEVPAIEGKAGWLMRNALVDRLGSNNVSSGTARYRLDVWLHERPGGLRVASARTPRGGARPP